MRLAVILVAVILFGCAHVSRDTVPAAPFQCQGVEADPPICANAPVWISPDNAHTNIVFIEHYDDLTDFGDWTPQPTPWWPGNPRGWLKPTTTQPKLYHVTWREQ